MSLLRKGYLYYSFEHSTHKLKYIQYCSLPWSQDCLPTRVHTQSVSAGGSPIANVHMVDVCLLGVAHSIRCSNIVVYQHTGQASHLYNGMGMGYGMAGVWQYISVSQVSIVGWLRIGATGVSDIVLTLIQYSSAMMDGRHTCPVLLQVRSMDSLYTFPCSTV